MRTELTQVELIVAIATLNHALRTCLDNIEVGFISLPEPHQLKAGITQLQEIDRAQQINDDIASIVLLLNTNPVIKVSEVLKFVKLEVSLVALGLKDTPNRATNGAVELF